MSYATRLLAFAAGLAVLFAASFGVGSLLDVTAPGASAEGAGDHMERMGGVDPVTLQLRVGDELQTVAFSEEVR